MRRHPPIRDISSDKRERVNACGADIEVGAPEDRAPCERPQCGSCHRWRRPGAITGQPRSFDRIPAVAAVAGPRFAGIADHPDISRARTSGR
jgi:hypothetical protein